MDILDSDSDEDPLEELDEVDDDPLCVETTLPLPDSFDVTFTFDLSFPDEPLPRTSISDISERRWTMTSNPIK